MDSDAVYIYALVDPRTKEPRYIGKTKNMRARLLSHLREKKHAPKNIWITELLESGSCPEIVLIEETTTENWESAERRWIAHYRSLGAGILNVYDGGNGPHNRSEAFVECMRRLATGRPKSEETRLKLSKGNKGKVRSAETRKKMSEHCAMRRPEVVAKNVAARIGRKMSEETKAKIAAKARGRRHSQEARTAMSVSRTGRKHSDATKRKCSEIASRRLRDALTGRFIYQEGDK